jgi:hypothetical protein
LLREEAQREDFEISKRARREYCKNSDALTFSLSTLEEVAIGSTAGVATATPMPGTPAAPAIPEQRRLRRRRIPKGLKKEKAKDPAGMLQGESRPRRHRAALI